MPFLLSQSSTRHMYVLASTSAAVLLLASTYVVYAARTPSQPLARLASALSVTAGPATVQPQSSNAVAAAPTQMMEMHIANNGLMLLRGARVVSLASGVVTVRMSWGGGTFLWRANTSYGTSYIGTQGQKVQYTDVNVGDIVTITGSLIVGNEDPTLAASTIRVN